MIGERTPRGAGEQAERDLLADLDYERWDEEPTERQHREWLEGRASCRLPPEQRLSDETRRGSCRMLGIDPDDPDLQPRRRR